MIRQAHTYLAGAVSGTALIAVAIVAFVLLVSAQAIRDWPLGGLGFAGGDSAAVSPGDTDGADAASAAGGGDADAAAKAGGAGGIDSGAGSDSPQNSGAVAGGSAPGTTDTSSPSPDTPVSNSPGDGTNGGGGNDAPTGSASSPGSGGGGGSQPGGSGGGGGGGGATSPSGTVAGAVNDTVAGVDTVTGGAVSGAGVTKVTEGVVEGTVGPESTVGQTVDKAGETVGGLLPGGH